MGELKP
jgi:hypothetical protein